MNELQNLFLGANVAVIVRDENEFNKLREWMAEKNLFLANKEPVNKMQYPGSKAGVYRNVEDLAVYWSPVNDLAGLGYKSTDLMNFLFSDKKIIDADVEIVNEVSNIDLDISITKVVPATITSNIKDLKEITIPKIKQYAKTIVTAENYKDIDTMLTNLRKAKETLNRGKIATKKEASKTITEFEEDVKEILAVFDDVITNLAEQTNAFKSAEKEAKRKELEDTISKLKSVLIENNMISKEYADKFEFDEKWLNKSTTQKAFKEAVEKQFNELMEQEKKDKEVLNAIVETIKSQNVPEGSMNQETYITLYKQGMSLGEVLSKITVEGRETFERITRIKEKAVEEARETIVQETVNSIEQSVNILKEDTTAEWIQYFEDTTGELLGHSNGEEIKVKIQPEKNHGKLYRSIYAFEGDFASLKTLALAIKLVMKINKTFKRREIKVKEKPVLISKDKEGNYIIEEIKKEGNE